MGLKTGGMELPRWLLDAASKFGQTLDATHARELEELASNAREGSPPHEKAWRPYLAELRDLGINPADAKHVTALLLAVRVRLQELTKLEAKASANRLADSGVSVNWGAEGRLKSAKGSKSGK
jgi:hypothetical protein